MRISNAIIDRRTGDFSPGAIFTALLLVVGLLVFVGCSEPEKVGGNTAMNGGLPASKAFDDTSSKNTALFGTIGAQPGVTEPVKRLADVGERLNGAATTQDYKWAEAIAASEEAADKARKQADTLATQNKALREQLAKAPTPEDLQKATERGNRVEAELTAFSTATSRNGLIGVAVVLLCGFLAWQTENARIFGWGVLASLSLNLEPYLIKRIAESPALGYAITTLIGVGTLFGLYEAWKSWRASKSEAKGATADAPNVSTPTSLANAEKIIATVEAGAATAELAAASWFTRAWRAVKAWFAKVWAKVRARFTISTPLA